MHKAIIFLMFVFLSCSKTYINTEVGPEGRTINLQKARFTFPKGAIEKTTTLRIEMGTGKPKQIKEGFTISKTTFTITPETLTLAKPVLFSFPVSNIRENLAIKFNRAYLPIADSKVENETLYASINHPGKYCLVEMPEKYGILNDTKTSEALLLISDLHTGDYLENFRRYLSKQGYSLPIWTFIYPPGNTIRENAEFLHKELEKLHEKYGNFRLDIVAFGIGGIISRRYEHDPVLYGKDLGSAIIAVGTPFKGTIFASKNNVSESGNAFGYYFIDGMGRNAKDLAPNSSLINWIKENRNKVRISNFTDTRENSNFASIRGILPSTDESPIENAGDGLISLSSTYLTPLEPEPFQLDHFQLYENEDVYGTIKDFLDLYRSFNWPELFLSVWKGDENLSVMNEIWNKEVNLHFRNRLNFELLLDFNENLLLSVPQNGILITNGDNDTYPGWFLQSKGVRKDVLIVNWSLLNVVNNVLYLKKQGLPIPLTDLQIRTLKPVRKKSGEIVFPADSLIKLLIMNKERPVVFATTVSTSRIKKYDTSLAGLVFELAENDVNIEKTKKLFHSTYKLNKTFSVPPESLNLVCKMMTMNYTASLYKLTNVLVKQKKYDEALTEIVYARKFPVSPHFLSPLSLTEASIYYKQGNPEKAEEALNKALDIEKNTNIIMGVAEIYYENENKERAITVLADWLKDNPDDKEILRQLAKYGGE